MGRALGKWLRSVRISKKPFPPLGEGNYKASKIDQKHKRTISFNREKVFHFNLQLGRYFNQTQNS